MNVFICEDCGHWFIFAIDPACTPANRNRIYHPRHKLYYAPRTLEGVRAISREYKNYNSARSTARRMGDYKGVWRF